MPAAQSFGSARIKTTGFAWPNPIFPADCSRFGCKACKTADTVTARVLPKYGKTAVRRQTAGARTAIILLCWIFPILHPSRSTRRVLRRELVCAFAESAEWFADEAAFAARQEKQEFEWATQSFIPVGMFADENAPEGTRPAARALFTGIVRSAEQRYNTVSRSPFYYCEIETFGGIWSAVYPAAAFADTPQAGNVIQGEYWLTGK
ncbi:Uncharacterised protein [Kingella potus]|uniref:Uncharacterized protein n=1 Tax=Kingella potus TaxID=265175 RepID=A0A377R121_9NEIS|nr:Uncharacterised protein [Kingella potus]